MKAKDLRPATDQVLRHSGELSESDTQLYRVLGIAPAGETYHVENTDYVSGHEDVEGRYACVKLVGSGDPEIIRGVTLEDFLAGAKLDEAEADVNTGDISWSLEWAALDSLADLAEASEDELRQLLEWYASGLCGDVEHGMSAMADQWEETLPLIKELSYRRMWHDALGHESWEAFVSTRFGAVLTRWRDIGALEQRVLELTTGEDAMSNRMAAVVAGTSEWTVRQIKKDAGAASQPARGRDDKTRAPRVPRVPATALAAPSTELLRDTVLRSLQEGERLSAQDIHKRFKGVKVTEARVVLDALGRTSHDGGSVTFEMTGRTAVYRWQAADPAEAPTTTPRPAPEQPQAPAEDRGAAPEQLGPDPEQQTEADLTHELQGWIEGLPDTVLGAGAGWPESLAKDWAATVARCWPTEPIAVKFKGVAVGTLTFAPLAAESVAEPNSASGADHEPTPEHLHEVHAYDPTIGTPDDVIIGSHDAAHAEERGHPEAPRRRRRSRPAA